MGKLEQEEEQEEVLELSGLEIEAVGLVRRPAVRKRFFLAKSEGDEHMSDETQDFSAVIDELEQVEQVNAGAWQKVVEVLKSIPDRMSEMLSQSLETGPPAESDEQFAGLTDADKGKIARFLKDLGDKVGDRVNAVLSGMIEGYEPEPEPSSEEGDDMENFQEQIEAAKSEVAEQFAEQLRQEREARGELEQRLAASERARRLREFVTEVESYALPVGEAEQFAADLMAIHDQDEALYGRLTTVLKAANEAALLGGVFEQASAAAGTVAGDPFEAMVEKVRQERFAELGADEGWVKAFDAVGDEHPDLARAYATRH